MLESSSIVRQFAKVVPEHLFVQIPEQVELLHAHISSLESALEQTPEVFETVSVDLSVNVFLRMVDNLMLESLFPESLIGHKGIGIDRAACFDMGANLSLQSVFLPIADNRAANFSAAFQNADDGHFVFCSSLSNPALALIGVHEAGGPADESFVHFDLAPAPTEFQNRTVLHGESDALKHEPCGLLSDAKGAAYFVRTDSVLAVGKHPHSDKPFVEGECRILKDGSDFNGELFASVLVLAFPHAASRDKANVFAPASGALDAIGPPPRNHESEAVVGIAEMQDGLLECSWLFHGVPHSQKYARNALLSQVYYCPYEKLSCKSFRIRTYKNRGVVGAPTTGLAPHPYPSVPLPTYPLSFHILADSFALCKIISPFFSCNSGLFAQNTRGWGRVHYKNEE